jgi:putative DNA primase/helicase
VMRYRLKRICEEMGVGPSELNGKLWILDTTVSDPTLYREEGRGSGIVTPTYERLDAFLVAKGAGLVVVDNASDAYDASEIDRAKVRAFIRALAKIARASNAGIVLLAHVDKGTSRGERAGTEGYSGSTAWNNSARSRLFMRQDGSEDRLVVEHQKANHSRKHSALRLRRPDGQLVPVLCGQVDPMVDGVLDRSDTKALLCLIAEFNSRGEYIATSRNSRNHAGKMLHREALYPKGLRADDLFVLLRQAERAGYLERFAYKSDHRKDKERWEVTGKGREFANIAPCAPCPQDGAPSADPDGAAPSAPSSARGYGGKRARNWEVKLGAEEGNVGNEITG